MVADGSGSGKIGWNASKRILGAIGPWPCFDPETPAKNGFNGRLQRSFSRTAR